MTFELELFLACFVRGKVYLRTRAHHQPILHELAWMDGAERWRSGKAELPVPFGGMVIWINDQWVR